MRRELGDGAEHRNRYAKRAEGHGCRVEDQHEDQSFESGKTDKDQK